jgi:murein DD-endopeptidase MepM/ murein hydrolase activator NlpD
VPDRIPRPVSARLRPILAVAFVVAIGVFSAAVGPAGRPASTSAGSGTGAGSAVGAESATRPSSAATGQGREAPSADGAAPADLAHGTPGTALLTPGGALVRVPDPAVRGAPPTPVPEVVRFRPRNGWADVSPGADLSVRFTTAMNHASTEAAFTATILGSAAIDGSVQWAEDGTVLVLDPRTSLAAGARIQLQVSAGALSAEGIPIAAPSSVTFTVAAASPAPPKAPAATVAAGWRWPLIGPITQYFGQRLTVYGFHQGIDIDGDTGDPVRAAHSGRVVVAGNYDDCGGLEVHVDHGDGITSWYRHLSRIDVAVGATVEAGSVIGLVGETGCAFGSHLHFGVRVGSTFVDPLRYLPPR